MRDNHHHAHPWRSSLSVCVLALVMSGCTSWFLNGAVEHEGAPASYVARFVAPSCTMANGQETVGAVGQWYYLAQDERGTVLYELDGQGKGAAITNRWTDGGFLHFFVWVPTSQGWTYSFPMDQASLPVRRVFLAGTFETTDGPNEATIPVGQPAFTCQLVPQ